MTLSGQMRDHFFKQCTRAFPGLNISIQDVRGCFGYLWHPVLESLVNFNIGRIEIDMDRMKGEHLESLADAQVGCQAPT